MPVALTRRAKLLMPVCLVALVGLSVWRLAPGGLVRDLRLSGESMGTTYSVVIPAATAPSAELKAEVAAELERIEGLMSTYIAESEVSRFNLSRATQPMGISRELAEVLKISLELYQLSGGGFDVSVRPLVALWGFGAGANAEPPTPQQIESARLLTGSDHLRVQSAPGDESWVTKAKPELEIDLSAVAKGYAVDRVVELLRRRGFHNFMVEVGGEIRVSGKKTAERPWRLGIEKPDAAGRAVQMAVMLEDRSLATSGDYRNYYERDGKRISHTIDPRDGSPISHGLASVSVVHKSAAWADGWATALNVLGPEQGFALAETEGLSALFIVRLRDGGFATRPTTAFSRLTTDPQLATPPVTSR